MGRLHAQRQDTANALQAFEHVLALNPQNLEAYLEMARLLARQKPAEKAFAPLKQVLKIVPNHAEALQLMARVYLAEGDFAEALPVLETLLHNGLATPEALHDDYTRSLRALGSYDQAIAFTCGLLAEGPPRPVHYRKALGDTYFEMEDYAEAIVCYRTVLEQAGEEKVDAKAVQARLAAALCNEGVRRYQAGEPQGALTLYEEALTHDTENPDIYYNLGKAHALLGNLEAALQHFTEALRLNPRDGATHYEMALVYDHQEDFDTALHHYEVALQCEPEMARAAFGMGTLYGLREDFPNAVRYLKHATELDNTDVDAFYNLGVALERVQEPQEAMAMYAKAVALAPHHKEAQTNLALLREKHPG